MKSRPLSFVVATLVVSTPLAFAAPAAGLTGCERAASRMAQSCRAEAYEEFHAGSAGCWTIAAGASRNACLAAASAAWREALDEECDALLETRLETCELLDENFPSDPLADPGNTFVDLDEIGGSVEANPFFSLVPGHTRVLRAGEDFEEIVVVTVTHETVEINGQDCRVVVDVVLTREEDEEEEDAGGAAATALDEPPTSYQLVELTDDFYAQTTAGDVVYCGEDTVEYLDGFRDGTDGSFRSGYDGAYAGWLIRASPLIGSADRQELLLGEAEDVVQYVSATATPGEDLGGENAAFPCAGGCLQVHETVPIEPGIGEYKFYTVEDGFVLGVALEDGEPTGERDELACVGDSLAVLEDPGCGIEDLDELLETLCEAAPHAFCDEDAPEE